MLDLLVATDPSMGPKLQSALQAVAAHPGRPSRIWSGPWGCLAVAGAAYPGFDPVETKDHILVVLGGPLPRHDWSVTSVEPGDEGSRWVLDRWARGARLRWEDDLVGHFAVVNIEKSTARISAVTDINSFVPLYDATLSSDTQVMLIGSHSDALAVAAGRVDRADETSVADFLLYGTVTSPYTLYDGVRQLPAATVFAIERLGTQTERYWMPEESEPPGTFRECAAKLRELLVHNVKRICAGSSRVGLLLSAGEDSRVVAALAAGCTDVQAVTLVDSFNREARLASRIADRSGVGWQAVIRDKDHYLLRSAEATLLAEHANLFLHAHCNGFSDRLPARSRVLGGLMADAFWKGSHVGGWRRGDLQLTREPTAWEYDYSRAVTLPDEIGRLVLERRKAHSERLCRLRPSSWAEWHSLVPASMNSNLTQLFVNRRLFASYEPFVDAAMVRFSASIPQEWKMNRKLFHAAMGPLLCRTRTVPHGKGFYPCYGLWLNAPLLVLGGLSRRARAVVYHRLLKRSLPNDGPWPAYDHLAESDLYYGMVAERTQSARRVMSSPFWRRVAAYTKTGDLLTRFRAFQMLAWADWRHRATSGMRPSDALANERAYPPCPPVAAEG